MDFIVRTATVEDTLGILNARYSAIHRLGAKFYSDEVCSKWGSPITEIQVEKFKKSILNETNITFVAEFNSKIIGFSRLSLPDTVSAVYVDFDHMRFGVGAHLLKKLEDYAVENRVKALKLDSSLSAEAFYRKHGYSVVGRGTHTLSSGAEMESIFMEKSLLT